MNPLRQHMKEMHKLRHGKKLPRSNADLVSLHRHEHHHYATNHIHLGENRGPGTRPPGWTTGGDAVRRCVECDGPTIPPSDPETETDHYCERCGRCTT